MRGHPIKCDFHECTKDAYVFICWGKHGQAQQANVCREHCRETWEAVGSQIRVGICWWIQEAPKPYTSGHRHESHGRHSPKSTPNKRP